MESRFPRCVHCMAPLPGNSGLMGAFKALLRNPITCSSCGRRVSFAEGRLTAKTFAQSVARFQMQLNEALKLAPVLNQAQALTAIGARLASRDVHKIHTRDELGRLLARCLRMSLRHEALGHASPITIEALRRAGRVRALLVHGARTNTGALERLILLARVGPDDYLIYEVSALHAGGAIKTMLDPEIRTNASADTALGMTGVA
jgi:hypothetical protein